MSEMITKVLFSNWRIKSYAALVSFAVWAVILGQRSLVITREVPVDYLLNPTTIIQDAVDKVRISIKGKRSVLHDFEASSAAPIIDLRGMLPGPKRILIRKDSISLPIGAKIVSITPKYITFYLRVKSLSDSNSNQKGAGDSSE